MNDAIRELKLKANSVRRGVLDMVYESKAGHIGGSMSSIDILTTLYYKVLNINPKNFSDSNRDRFVLSKGHISESLYYILADRGFFDKEKIKTYSKYNSSLIGHPNNKNNGVEVNTGSLGHGLPISVGMALAGKMDNKSYKVYTLMGDGELAEGSVWEGAMSASNYKLDNLIGIVDRNRLQISGNTEDVMALEDLSVKWKGFGWEVVEVDGNDIEELLKVFESVPLKEGRPTMIIANTIKGKGISFMENKAKWHHGVLNEEQYNQAVKELEGCDINE